MGALGYSVVNVGSHDLIFGLDVLRETAKKASLTLISANLVSKSTGKPLFEPYTVREVAGFRVGYLGVIRDNPAPATSDGEIPDLQVTDPKAALQEWVPRVRKECDLLIVFAFVGNRQAQAFADEVKGMDVVIAGGDGFVDTQAAEIGTPETGRTLVCNAGNQGKYVGALSLVMSEHGKVLRYTHAMHGLDATVEHKAEMTATVEAFKESLREIRKKEQVESVVGTASGPTEKFLGSSVCSRCHEQAFQVWSNSAHAHALATLEGKQKEKDAACLKCHVTGYGAGDGYQANRADLANVSCEQCHGYGTMHGATGFHARPARESCVECHDASNSPHFDYDSYWKAIAH